MKKLIYKILSATLLLITANVKAQCWLTTLADELALPGVTNEFKSFVNNNPNGLAAYEVVYKARGAGSALKKDVDLLTKVDNLLQDQQFLNRIGGQQGLEDIITANKRVVCKTCSKLSEAEHLQNINDYLDDVKHFTDNYYNVNGFAEVIKDLKKVNSTGSYNMSMEAAGFMLRVLKKKQALFAGTITRFEGSIDDLLNGRRYDIIFNNGNKVTFGEFKSYASGSLSNFLTTGGDTYQQFTTYIGKINSLNELNYFFDIGKITDITTIKNRFKAVFKTNAQDIFNKNKNLFKQFNKLDNSGKIEDWEDFRDLFNHPNFTNDHPILDFIKLD